MVRFARIFGMARTSFMSTSPIVVELKILVCNLLISFKRVIGTVLENNMLNGKRSRQIGTDGDEIACDSDGGHYDPPTPSFEVGCWAYCVCQGPKHAPLKQGLLRLVFRVFFVLSGL
jgi:hypothetical protein